MDVDVPKKKNSSDLDFLTGNKQITFTLILGWQYFLLLIATWLIINKVLILCGEIDCWYLFVRKLKEWSSFPFVEQMWWE